MLGYSRFATLCALLLLGAACNTGEWLASQLAEKEDTVYAPGYSEAAFRKVNAGMSEADVRRLVGEPLETFTFEDDGATKVGWKYAKSANDQSYYVRVVHFDQGRVVDVLREFYLD